MKEKPDIGEISFPEIVEQPVMWGYDKDLHQANKHKAIVNFDTGKLFSIVSNDYRLIRHEEAIEQIEKAIFDVPGLGRCETFTEFYNDMGRMRRTYRFSEKTAEIEPDDYINPELHLFNSYDVTWPFIITLGAFRVLCTNGLVVAEKFLCLKKRHVLGLDQINPKEQVSTALKRFGKQTDKWKEWANRQLTEKTYKKVIKDMKFGKKAMEKIENRIYQEAEDFDKNSLPIMSVWMFFNVLTWYITHKAVSLNHRVDMEKRLRAAMVHLMGR
jgi:hypothetical protein